MAKEIQPKTQVIREYTENEIKGLGSTYLLKKKSKVWVLLLFCALAITVVLTRVFKPSLIAAIVDILPLLIVFGFFWYKSQQMGKKIWDYVRKQKETDKEKPAVLPF